MYHEFQGTQRDFYQHLFNYCRFLDKAKELTNISEILKS